MNNTVAIIGYGYWGPNLLRNFYKHFKVKYVCDVNPKTTSNVHNLYSSVQVITSYDDVLKDPEINAVVLATPIETHYTLARKALESGKHVLVEKPLCNVSKDAIELKRLADQKKLVLMTDFTFLYTGAVNKIKETIDNNKIGTVRYFDSVRVNLGLVQKKVNVVWDLAPHDLSILYYVLDSYFKSHKNSNITVSSSGMSFIDPKIENIAYINLNINDEIMANFHLNWMSPVKIRQTLICGTEKMIVYNDIEPTEKIKIYDSGVEYDKAQYHVNYRTGDIVSPKLDTSEALDNMVKDFKNSIETVVEPRANFDISYKVVKTIESIQRSMTDNKTIRIAF